VIKKFAFDPIYCMLCGTLVDSFFIVAKICSTGKGCDIDIGHC